MKLASLERKLLEIKDGLMESLINPNDIKQTRCIKSGMCRDVLTVLTFRIVFMPSRVQIISNLSDS